MNHEFTREFAAFAAGLGGFIVFYFITQMAVFNFLKIRELVLTCAVLAFACGFVWWLAFYFASAAVFPDPAFRALLSASGLFGSVGFSGTYIVLGPLSADRSLSAHMCIHMLRAGGRMTKAELMSRYTQEMVFEKRFSEYFEKGVMSLSGQDLILTARGRRIARVFLAILKALRMKENF